MPEERLETEVPLETQSWVWVDKVPTAEEMLERLKSLPDVFGVKIADYADYVLPMKQSQKVKHHDAEGKSAGETYVSTVRLYMQVAGRVMMLHDAQVLHEWTVIERKRLICTEPFVTEIEVLIEGLGNRFGTSKAGGGDNPWEKMETAARGRAIAAWGFGVIPGSGIASFEEMEEVAATPRQRSRGRNDEKRTRPELLEGAKAAIEELRLFRKQDPDQLYAKVQKYLADQLGVKVVIGEGGLNLEKLKDGQLALLEDNLRQQLAREQQAESGL